MNIQRKYIIFFIIIIPIIIFNVIMSNKEAFSLSGHKLLCDYKLIDHQHKIIDNLWLGDYESSQDSNFLK